MPMTRLKSKRTTILLALLTGMALVGAAPASAFDLDFLIPSFLSRKPAAPPVIPQPERARPAPARQAPKAFAVPTTDTEKPSPDAKQIVTVVGDSLGIQLGQGLREALKDRPEIGLVNKARGNTGLVNMSERDWPKFMRELANSPDRNTVTLIMIGANDNQALRDELGGYQEPMSDKWVEIYTRRVDDMIAPLQDKKIPVIWVGLPATKYEKMTANFLLFNKI